MTIPFLMQLAPPAIVISISAGFIQAAGFPFVRKI
jgi:hypothetical protein